MMEKIKTLIWYTVVAAVLWGVWFVGSSFRIAMVEDGFTAMEPAVEGRGFLFLDRRTATIRELQRDDIVAFKLIQPDGASRRIFARVVAGPGKTVSVRDGRLLSDGADVSAAPAGLEALNTGLIVPRDSVFVTFDSPNAESLPLPQRLVPFRNIIGRKMGG